MSKSACALLICRTHIDRDNYNDTAIGGPQRFGINYRLGGSESRISIPSVNFRPCAADFGVGQERQAVVKHKSNRLD